MRMAVLLLLVVLSPMATAGLADMLLFGGIRTYKNNFPVTQVISTASHKVRWKSTAGPIAQIEKTKKEWTNAY